MRVAIDGTPQEKPKRVAVVASNPAVSKQTGWPIGFWWAELVHPYWEFVEAGYGVELFSPDGGKLEGDKWSDPRDDSNYSAEDLLSLGFIHSPDHLKLVENSKPLSELKADNFDAILFVGGQGPMYTFYDDARTHKLAAFYEAGKIARSDLPRHRHAAENEAQQRQITRGGEDLGRLRQFRGRMCGQVRGAEDSTILDRRRSAKIAGKNFVMAGRFRPFAVRDGRLLTGQQQYSGSAAARFVIETLGR